MEENLNRRSFFKLVAMAGVAAPLILKPLESLAATACPTTPPAGKQVAVPGEGMAKSLEYVADSNTSKNAKFKKGQHCWCKSYMAK
jgi:hypothetical protein